MGNQVIGTAIQVVGSDDMIAGLHNILECVCDSRSTRGNSQSGYTTFEGSYSVFEHALSRVGQTTVDVTCIAQTKAVGSVL